MSYRLKIILGVVGIQALMLVFMIWNGLAILKSSNEEALLTRIKSTTRLLATTAQPAVMANDLAALDSYVEEVLANPGIVYARVLSNRGTLAAEGDKLIMARKFEADINLASTEQDGVFDAYAEIIVAGQKYGRVEIGFSTTPILQLISNSRDSALLRAFVGLTLVGLFALALGYQLTRSLSALQQGARKIADGDLGYQISITSRDELAKTSIAFNEMSVKLKALNNEHIKKDAEIQALNQQLEQRVVERTLQLQDANKQLEHQTLHDALTRLPNRVLFHDRLRSTLLTAHRTHDPFALVEVDLDLFKEINDTLGHQAGDLVLQHVADACNRTLRDSDTVARMGGDEFAILLPKVTDIDEAIKVVERVLEAIKTPLKIDGRDVHVSASMGIAMFPEHGDEATELFNHSDAAMYVAKQKKLGIVVYRREMGEGNTETAALKADLRHAINAHELLLYFQPKIDINSKTIIGVEALLRWEHPRLGMLYPDTFIVLAETSGLIKQLTQEVLRIAMQQIHTWRDEGISLPVAVNVSAVNLQDADFPDSVAAIIAEHQVPSHMLELEVTETAIMTEPLRAIENIRKLSDMGVLVSIDDFGTGYSSLAYLQKLMVAKIKIDKSFVMEMATGELDEVIVRSTIDLAHNMGLKAVAEGVETQEAWDKLREMGCDSAQGYFMSKPLPPDKLMAWINESEWSGKLQAAS